MPDISMCKNQYCEDRDTCYRYIAISSAFQAFLAIEGDKNKDTCEHYWKDDGSFVTVKSRGRDE